MWVQAPRLGKVSPISSVLLRCSGLWLPSQGWSVGLTNQYVNVFKICWECYINSRASEKKQEGVKPSHKRKALWLMRFTKVGQLIVSYDLLGTPMGSGIFTARRRLILSPLGCNLTNFRKASQAYFHVISACVFVNSKVKASQQSPLQHHLQGLGICLSQPMEGSRTRCALTGPGPTCCFEPG